MRGIGGGTVDQQPRGFDLHCHFGDLQLHRLEFDNRLAEGLALLDILGRGLQRGSRHAEALGGIAAAFQPEGAHQLGKAARADDDVFGRHPHILDRIIGGGDAAEAHQLLALAELHAGQVFLQQDRADALGPGFIGETAISDVIIRMAAAAGPALVTVDHVVVPVEHRAGFQIGQRRARVGFGHRNRDHLLAPDHFGKHLRLHLGRAELVDGAHRADQRLEHRESDRVGNLGKFLQHQQRFKVAEAQPAIFDRKVDPQKAHLAIGAKHVVRDGIVLRLHVACQRGQFLLREFARGFLQLALLVGQLEVHGRLNPLSWLSRPLAHL